MTSPTPIGKQSLIAPPPAAVEPAPQPVPQAAPVPYVSPDVTGSIAAPQASAAGPVLPSSGQKITTASIPAGERLPETIGSTALRSAALKGDASAAFEIGVRYAEGKGVAQNYDEAAKWYDRAAQANVVPAMFRLGTLFEKGLGAKKDLDVARRYYVLAADRGNAKAMHNLAVLDADGGAKGANYKSASYWFRKAADRGVADSQFNLGILYARGIGVEQNLAESFKWFSLAGSPGRRRCRPQARRHRQAPRSAVAGRSQAGDPDLRAGRRSPTTPLTWPLPRAVGMPRRHRPGRKHRWASELRAKTEFSGRRIEPAVLFPQQTFSRLARGEVRAGPD